MEKKQLLNTFTLIANLESTTKDVETFDCNIFSEKAFLAHKMTPNFEKMRSLKAISRLKEAFSEIPKKCTLFHEKKTT